MARKRTPSKADLAEVARGKGSARDRAEASAYNSRRKAFKVRHRTKG